MDKQRHPTTKTIPVVQNQTLTTNLPRLQLIAPQTMTGSANRSTPFIITGSGMQSDCVLAPGETTPNVLASGPATLMVTDDIHHQNQSAQLFIERLLLSSCSQIRAEGTVLNTEHLWSGIQIGSSPDSHVAENMVVKMSTSPTIQGTESMMLQSISPQSNVSSIPMVTVKQSVSPTVTASSASPSKRLRRHMSDSREASGRRSSCADRMEPARGSSGVVVLGEFHQKRARSISEGSSDSASAGAPRASLAYEGGRTSRERSESESDMSDTMVIMGCVTPDDTRRQMTGSVTPETSDVGFQPSMLEAVLTEKKMALLRSPDIRNFLKQQQGERAREQKLLRSARTIVSKGDNS